MASQEFTVLYTHQKMKKSKTWQDGILRVRTGRNQATLFDDKGQCLESIFIKSQVTPGDDLESERYLITVEAVKVSEKPSEDQPRKAETPAVDRNGVKPSLLPPRHLPVGLKRKFTGFQGPRQVEKKIPAVEDEEKPTVLPLSKQCQGSFPSQFYISSPLFSTIRKKDAETNPSAGFQEEGCKDRGREHMSVSSLLSAPFTDSCEETEKENSDQFVVKTESPLLTGPTDPRAVSHHIRSTAQIIALLKSKPAQGHREQTSGVTGCLSTFQTAENADLYDKESPVLAAFSGNPAKGLIPDTQCLPFTQGTGSDKKDWNAETLPNSAEQPGAEVVTGQRQDKKVNNLRQGLQDHCDTDSCFLPECTVSRMSDSQFVPSSGDISRSASPTTFENNPFGYREQHSGTDKLRENLSVEMQSELHPRQNSEGVSSDPELSGDVTLTEAGVVKEEFSLPGKDCSSDEELMEVNFSLMETFDFNDTDNEDMCEREVKELAEGDTPSQSPGCLQGEDVAQDAASRLHSCCEVETHSKNEVKCSSFDGDGGTPPQLCDSDARRTAEDSANQTTTEVALLSDGHNIKEINESQSSFEATNNEEYLDGCAALTISGTLWIRNQHSDLLPGDTIVNECHPETSVFEATGSIPGISPSRMISAMDKKTEEGVTQFGCMESPDVGSEHFWGTKSDDIKPGSPLLALSQKSDPLGTGYSSPEETAVGDTELENASPEAYKGETTGVDCLKCTAVAENSSGLPDLVNDIALLRALTQHSTALESLQKMEESNSVFCETEASKETLEPLEKDEATKEFTEMPYSESLQASSCSYFDSPGLMPNCVDSLLQKTEAYIVPIAAAQRDPGTSDWQPKPVAFQGHQVKGSAASEVMLRAPCSQLGWQQHLENMDFAAETFFSPLFSRNYDLYGFRQSPGSRSLRNDDVDVIREGNFQMKPDAIEEPGMNESSLALDVYPELPPWTVSGSPSHSDLRQAQWTAWEPGKISSALTSPLDPDSTVSPASGNEETIGDIWEPLTHGFLPSEPELPDFFFTREKSSSPEECSLPRLKPMVKPRTPFVTLPVTEETPDVFYPTESEEVQRSLGSSGGNLCSESVAFPWSAPGPEDRSYETSVFGEYTEDRQKGSVPPVLPNLTAQHRQSKWLKYQNSAQRDLIPENSADGEENDDICAQSVLRMLPGDTGEGRAMNPSAPSSALLLPASSAGERCANSSHPDLVSEGKVFSLHLRQTPLAAATQKVLSHLSCHSGTADSQDITISELSFPPADKVKHANLPKRKISIPAVFQSHTQYKQVFKAALTEQLNVMLFELAQRLHNALSKVDISFYTTVKDRQSQSQGSCAPLCNHMHPAKLVMVKKEGQNKGRLFYACDAPKAEQCSFFKWIEDVNPTQTKSRPSAVLHDTKSIGTYLRSQKIAVYEECQLLVRKAFEIPTQRYSKFKKFMNTPASFDGDSKAKLYLKLSRKEHSSLYSKDDIWVVSKTLNFDPIDTFIASSAFFGPSSNNEIELLPLKGYSPSNWRSSMCVHALLVCNASGELAALRNMEEHFNPSTLPLIPYLLKMNFNSENTTKRVNKRKFTPPAMSLKRSMTSGPVSSEVAMGVAEEMIQRFSLNPDQATSLIHIAQMMTSCENLKPGEGHQSLPITIIRGVFGAGKSYLLSVVILFLVQLFGSSEAVQGPRATPWKLLIASSTNVAVDRILLGLLDLGFEDFIRVGSIRKITKAILPHSLHAGSGNENEQLKELLALMKEDLTPAEKIYVRKSIEQHKLGTNKTILQQVKVVGVTCAACPFPCLNALRFPVVMLDECSQMTEPASLLPIARFQCEKLVLVGDPKQLPPTVQGSESVHEQGLEQTLFDRLCLMGHNPILLRTQYRCHPALSAIANELFYEGNLIDGISEEDRTPLLEWLPTLCFYSVHGMEQIERDNSFYNMAEAHFTVKLIQSLIASGIEGAAIGVITLYKSQMYKIQNLLSGVHSEAFEVKPVQVSTVDAFQGAEREIIVLSCVRTRHFGFIDSEKRMNVALTRAKRHLLIVGSLACLSRNKLWGRVIHHCKGWENGLQHASQCEQQLNDILKSYSENWQEEELSKKKEK
ncbi:PREDICTED: protein ZGRF1 isoform X1 [Corvus brachyrhynchos]|uniref:protein ZGRF1 isoform X1 n=1 Tax=Corvus brachyrhynchos TaxID=85066 RepID=UPI0008164666|nr:PREDICTED: protein ZGRF1 isoform X1 [Corvus brachyrhynchos]